MFVNSLSCVCVCTHEVPSVGMQSASNAETLKCNSYLDGLYTFFGALLVSQVVVEACCDRAVRHYDHHFLVTLTLNS